MKEMRIKAVKVLSKIYGAGIAVALFAGALSFVGYLTAIIIGGQTAEAICVFIYKQMYPVLFYISSASVMIGMLKMYVAGEKTMTPGRKRNQKSKGNT